MEQKTTLCNKQQPFDVCHTKIYCFLVWLEVALRCRLIIFDERHRANINGIYLKKEFSIWN